MQYRTDFLISSAGLLFTNFSGATVFWILFNSVPTLVGWNFYEMLFIYAFYLLALSPAQIFFDHIWQLRHHLTSGTFLKYYFKPIDMMFYYMSEIFDLKGLSQVAFGLFALFYVSAKLGLQWTAGKLVLLGLSLFGASLIMISLLVIAGTSAFWIPNSISVLLFVFRLKEFAQYPMTIFDGFLKFLLTYLLPLGFIAFYPAQLFLRPNTATALAYFSPLVGLLCFGIAYLLWNKGVNHYSGTGT